MAQGAAGNWHSRVIALSRLRAEARACLASLTPGCSVGPLATGRKEQDPTHCITSQDIYTDPFHWKVLIRRSPISCLDESSVFPVQNPIPADAAGDYVPQGQGRLGNREHLLLACQPEVFEFDFHFPETYPHRPPVAVLHLPDSASVSSEGSDIDESPSHDDCVVLCPYRQGKGWRPQSSVIDWIQELHSGINQHGMSYFVGKGQCVFEVALSEDLRLENVLFRSGTHGLKYCCCETGSTPFSLSLNHNDNGQYSYHHVKRWKCGSTHCSIDGEISRGANTSPGFSLFVSADKSAGKEVPHEFSAAYERWGYWRAGMVLRDVGEKAMCILCKAESLDLTIKGGNKQLSASSKPASAENDTFRESKGEISFQVDPATGCEWMWIEDVRCSSCLVSMSVRKTQTERMRIIAEKWRQTILSRIQEYHGLCAYCGLLSISRVCYLPGESLPTPICSSRRCSTFCEQYNPISVVDALNQSTDILQAIDEALEGESTVSKGGLKHKRLFSPFSFDDDAIVDVRDTDPERIKILAAGMLDTCGVSGNDIERGILLPSDSLTIPNSAERVAADGRSTLSQQRHHRASLPLQGGTAVSSARQRGGLSLVTPPCYSLNNPKHRNTAEKDPVLSWISSKDEGVAEGLGISEPFLVNPVPPEAGIIRCCMIVHHDTKSGNHQYSLYLDDNVARYLGTNQGMRIGRRRLRESLTSSELPGDIETVIRGESFVCKEGNVERAEEKQYSRDCKSAILRRRARGMRNLERRKVLTAALCASKRKLPFLPPSLWRLIADFMTPNPVPRTLLLSATTGLPVVEIFAGGSPAAKELNDGKGARVGVVVVDQVDNRNAKMFRRPASEFTLRSVLFAVKDSESDDDEEEYEDENTVELDKRSKSHCSDGSQCRCLVNSWQQRNSGHPGVAGSSGTTLSWNMKRLGSIDAKHTCSKRFSGISRNRKAIASISWRYSYLGLWPNHADIWIPRIDLISSKEIRETLSKTNPTSPRNLLCLDRCAIIPKASPCIRSGDDEDEDDISSPRKRDKNDSNELDLRNTIHLVTRPPMWSSDMQAYTVSFSPPGRVTKASEGNFQIVSATELIHTQAADVSPDRVLVQCGRYGEIEERWHIDVKHPMSIIQAFTICMSNHGTADA